MKLWLLVILWGVVIGGVGIAAIELIIAVSPRTTAMESASAFYAATFAGIVGVIAFALLGLVQWVPPKLHFRRTQLH